MRKQVRFLAALSLMLVLLPAASFALTTPLIAGQNTVVGEVTVTNDGTNLTVTYQITDAAWCLTETHLYVSTSPPAKHSPGQFPYGDDDLGCVPSDQYVIPLADLGVGPGNQLYIAAHAVVVTGGGCADGICPILPLDPVTFTSQYLGGAGLPSYFDITLSDAGAYNGLYDGWCVDRSRLLSSNVPRPAMLICSYDAAAAALVDLPDNLDLLNYMINNLEYYLFVQLYSMQTIQQAMWDLIDIPELSDPTPPLPAPGPNLAHVALITADALANGEGFEPVCGEDVVIMVAPLNPDVQPTIIPVPVPCCEDETAWAFGNLNFSKGWGWYFTYTVQ